MAIKLPPFGGYAKVLKEAGVETGSARNFWGGVTKDDDIVVTIWIDESEGRTASQSGSLAPDMADFSICGSWGGSLLVRPFARSCSVQSLREVRTAHRKSVLLD